MPYSTIAALRANNPEINVVTHPTLTDAWCTAVIASADRWVRIKVQPLLAATIPDTAVPSCDEAITALSELAAKHEALLRMYGPGRAPSGQADIDKAKADRDELLGQIERREVNLVYADNVTTNWREDGRKPQFGQGKYGEYETSDEPGDDPDEFETREET